MIKSLHLTNAGPFAAIELTSGARLSLITGGSELGKSFISNALWWALTRQWPAVVNPALASGMPALPRMAGQAQVIAATQSPFVIGSTQSLFDGAADKWFDLTLAEDRIVALERRADSPQC